MVYSVSYACMYQKFITILNNKCQRTTNKYRMLAGGYSHIKVTGCSSYLLGVKVAVLVPLRMFSSKKSSVVAFVVPVSLLRFERLLDNEGYMMARSLRVYFALVELISHVRLQDLESMLIKAI